MKSFHLFNFTVFHKSDVIRHADSYRDISVGIKTCYGSFHTFKIRLIAWFLNFSYLELLNFPYKIPCRGFHSGMGLKFRSLTAFLTFCIKSVPGSVFCVL